MKKIAAFGYVNKDRATIAKHMEVLRDKGVCTWGVWGKQTFGVDALRDLKNAKYVIVFCEPTNEYFKLRVKKFLARQIDGDYNLVDKDTIPAYYRDTQECKAYVVFDKIENLCQEELDELVSSTGKDFKTAISGRCKYMWFHLKGESYLTDLLNNRTA